MNHTFTAPWHSLAGARERGYLPALATILVLWVVYLVLINMTYSYNQCMIYTILQITILYKVIIQHIKMNLTIYHI